MRRFAAALLLAVAVFGLGQGGVLRGPGVHPATVAHACVEDFCVVEAGAFASCMAQDACRAMVVTIGVAVAGYMIAPQTTNAAIASAFGAAYSGALSGTKYALDSLAGTINNAFSAGQVSVSPSAMEKAGLQNLAISISAGQGVALVEPGFGVPAGVYEFGTTSGTASLVVYALIPAQNPSAPGWTVGSTFFGADTVQYGGLQTLLTENWKILTPGGAILGSGSNTDNMWNCGATCTHQDGIAGPGPDQAGNYLSVEFKFGSGARHFGIERLWFNYRVGVTTFDAGLQANYPVGTFLVNHDSGYFDRIGFSNTATPSPPSLPQTIGDQQIAIGAGVATAGYIGSLIGKTVHQGGAIGDNQIAAGSATPTVTDAGGSTVPIVQPTQGTQTGIQIGLGTANGILTGIETGTSTMISTLGSILTGTTTLTGVATGILTGVTSIFTAIGTFFTTMTTAVNRFFDLTVPLDTSSFRSNASLMSTAFPFSIPWDVARMTHLAFDVTPVTPSLSFSICLSGGHVSSSCSSPPTVSLAVLDPFIGFIRWAVLLMFVVGIAYGYRRLAGASV